MVRTHKSTRLPNPSNCCPHCHTEFLSDPLAHSCPAKIKANEELEGISVQDDGKATCPQCQVAFDGLDLLKIHYLEQHIVMEKPSSKGRQRKVKVEQVVVKPDLDDEAPDEKLLCDQCPFIGTSEDLTWHVKHVHKDR